MFENNRVINKQYIETSVNTQKNYDKDIQAITSMYPELSVDEVKNKIILFLDFEYLFKGNCGSWAADIIIEMKDGTKYNMPKFTSNRPFPNKHWFRLSMKYKQKICKRGIPLIFNTYEYLQQISKIICVWAFYGVVTDDKSENVTSVFVYVPDFMPPSANSNIYTILSYETSLECQDSELEDCTEFSIFDKYDTMVELKKDEVCNFNVYSCSNVYGMDNINVILTDLIELLAIKEKSNLFKSVFDNDKSYLINYCKSKIIVGAYNSSLIPLWK